MNQPAHIANFTAANPGMMTLQGTNQYIVGKDSAVVIDVGINRVNDPSSPKGYRLVGDVAFASARQVHAARRQVIPRLRLLGRLAARGRPTAPALGVLLHLQNGALFGAMTVRTRGGSELHCSTLVLCPGLVEDWDATPGLQAAYADGWAASTKRSTSSSRRTSCPKASTSRTHQS